MIGVTRHPRKRLGNVVPLSTSDVPHAAPPIPRTAKTRAAAIYFPTCISRAMGRLPQEQKDRSVMDVSSSRTCEIGMTRSTGEVYRSYLYLLEKVSR